MKKLSILSLMLAMALFFTGCTNGELELYNTFLKSQDITSMESKTDISFSLNSEGVSGQTKEILEQVATSLNSLKISMDHKSQANEDGTVAKAQVDTLVDVGGVKTDLSLWVDVDMSNDTVEMNQIIKVPQMLMAMAGEEYANKEYILYDYNEVISASGMEMDYTELIDWSKELAPRISDFLKSYGESFESGVKMIEHKGMRVVDKKVSDIYELRLNDESFKKLMRYSVNDLMENEEVLNFTKEYMDMVFSIVEVTDPQARMEMDKEMKNLEKELPNIKASFNKFMDEFDKVKILGEEGLVIEYGIDKDGYLVSEVGSIDLAFDLETIANQVLDLNKDEMEALGMEGVVNLKVEFNTKVSNINQDITIDMPELTDKNSLKMSDMLKTLEEY